MEPTKEAHFVSAANNFRVEQSQLLLTYCIFDKYDFFTIMLSYVTLICIYYLFYQMKL